MHTDLSDVKEALQFFYNKDRLPS